MKQRPYIACHMVESIDGRIDCHMMKLLVGVVLLLLSEVGYGLTLVTPDDCRTFLAEATNGTCGVTAQVSQRSALRPNTYVLSTVNGVGAPGIVTVVPEGVTAEEGDIVTVEGTLEREGAAPVFRADRLEVVRHFSLPEAPPCKFSDFRRGALNGRRCAMTGRIHPRTVHYDAARKVTTLLLSYERGRAFVRVPGAVDLDAFAHTDARVVGCVFNTYDATGTLTDVALELSAPTDLVPLPPPETDLRTVALYVLAAALAVLLVVLAFVWVRSRRERIAHAAVARDRLRVAAELHDTIEQHLATARLYLSGIRDTDGLPSDVPAALQLVESVLAHAKVEVRDAVMNLRGEGMLSLPEEIRNLAGTIPGSAVRVRTRVVPPPAKIAPAVQRDLLAIVREAVTNALKHGAPKNVVIVGDRKGAAGETIYVLRVLNDGLPFAPEALAGSSAATGHYGLAGMRERAKRSGLRLSFGREGKWTEVRVEVKA